MYICHFTYLEVTRRVLKNTWFNGSRSNFISYKGREVGSSERIRGRVSHEGKREGEGGGKGVGPLMVRPKIVEVR